jgi:ribosomal protein S28E/S33
MYKKNAYWQNSGDGKTRVCFPGSGAKSLCRHYFPRRAENMEKSKYSETTVVAAFVAGAALAAGLTLLLNPWTGRRIRENIGEVKEGAMGKLRECAREARFKLSPKTKTDAFRYEGGDCWI